MPVTILRADARNLPLPDQSVDLIVTSPPYYALRSYQDGGEHYAGQIGAEPTPAEYIANLIDCTREWMRVLKPPGSIFCNLGDSYSKGQRLDSEFTVEDAAWLGGVIDSDGSISIHKQGTSYTAWMRVGQMRAEVVHRIRDVTGIGQVFQDKRGVWNWNAAAQQAASVLSRIWPWLHIKRRQALAAVELQSRKAVVGGKGRWNALTDDELRRRERIRAAVLAWNSGERDEYEPALLALPDLPMKARWVPPKSLLLLPERYRIAAVDELGLIARAVVIWSKPNGLPESVTDRVRRSHEDWVHLTREPWYYSAVDEIRQPHSTADALTRVRTSSYARQMSGAMNGVGHPLGALPGSVWEIATEPLRVPAELGVDHFAAFPTEWPRRLILGWSPSGICVECGDGRRPSVSAARTHDRGGRKKNILNDYPGEERTSGLGFERVAAITGYSCACPEPTAPTRPSVVVDPFGGTGTTALVASVLGRHGISVDRSADYCRLARWRTTDPGQIAKAMRVPAPPPVADGQGALFDALPGASR